MAAAKKHSTGITPKGLECPVCLDLMTVPIFNCESGHSLCNTCTMQLPTPYCPMCREKMTQIRNRHLEGMIAELEMQCSNNGCIYKLKPAQMEDHLKECPFRSMNCPHGLVFGKCSWSGRLKDMMEHFKERHQESSNVSSDTEVEVNNVDTRSDDRHLFLVTSGKSHFIITLKIDTSIKMAYWTCQYIGPKKQAQQWIYEIHLTSQNDNRRKVVYIEHCFNDAIKPEEVFKTGKCAMIPMEALGTYLRNKKMSFRFFIKRGGPQPAKENKKPDNDGDNNKKNHFNPNKQGKGTGGPKGPGPHKKFHKNNA